MIKDPNQRVTCANLLVALPLYEVVKKTINNIIKTVDMKKVTKVFQKEGYMTQDQNKSIYNRVIEKSPSVYLDHYGDISPVINKQNY